MKGGLARATVAACLGAIVLGAPGAAADEASLFSGPDSAPGRPSSTSASNPAPQLTNTGRLAREADPRSRARAPTATASSSTRTSSTTTTARRRDDPGDPRAGSLLLAGAGGTYTYPTDPDVREQRRRPRRAAGQAAGRRHRVPADLNTLADPERPRRRSRSAARRAAARRSRTAPTRRRPPQLFLTWHGNTAELVDAATRRPVAHGHRRDVDRRRRQVELTRPAQRVGPRAQTVRLAAGVGLWDRGERPLPRPRRRRRPPPARAVPATPEPDRLLQRRLPRRPSRRHPRRPSAPPDAAWWRDQLQGTRSPTATSRASSPRSTSTTCSAG